MVAVSTAVSVGAPDVLYPRLYIGGTANASAQVLLTDGTAVQGAGVTFLWRAPDQTQVEIAGVWDATGMIWRCAREVDTSGTWAVRMRCTTPQRQTDWMLFEVVDAPEADTAPGAAIWLAQSGQPLVTTNGGLLTGVRVTELEPIDTLDRSVALPGVAGSTDPQVKSTTVGAVADFAKAEAAEAAGSAAEAATTATQAATAASGAATTATQAASAAGTAKTDAAAAAQAAATSASQAATAGADAGAAAGTQAAQPYAQAAQVAKDAAVAAQNSAATSAANTDQVVQTVRGKSSRTSVPLALTDDVGFWLAYFTALGDFLTAGGKLAADGSLDTNLLKFVSFSDGSFRIKDAAGFTRFLIDALGGLNAPGISVTPNGLITAGSTILDPAGIMALGPHSLSADGTLNLPQVRMAPTSAAGLRIRDESGFIAWMVDNTGLPTGGSGSGSSTTSFSATEILERDARARAASSEPARQQVTTVAPLVTQIIHFLVYGQSLSCGYEGHPAISKADPYDNLMLGNSVHYGASATNWLVIGPQVFNDLKATVAGGAAGVMTPSEVAALDWTDDARGETVGETALAVLRRAFLDRLNLTASAAQPYTARRFLLSEAGSGGQTIEVLSKGNNPTRYPRIVDCATKAKAAATAAGLSYGVGAYLWLQGEANYVVGAGISNTAADYKARLYQLKADLNADLAVGLAGQSRPVPFFTYQTGGTYVNDAVGVGVSQGQLEFALENPDVFMVAPVYQVPDKYGHLSANGYRWMGEYFGKVMVEVLVHRRKWRPLSPLRATYRGQEVLLEFHVPAPPLQWGKPWLMTSASGTEMVAADFDNKGFVAVDDSGTMTGVTPDLVGDCTVRLTLPRAPVGALKIRYGTQATRGSGCLMDSDPAVANGLFTYLPSEGATFPDNIPSLIGKPYPLQNWCVIFEITAVAG